MYQIHCLLQHSEIVLHKKHDDYITVSHPQVDKEKTSVKESRVLILKLKTVSQIDDDSHGYSVGWPTL